MILWLKFYAKMALTQQVCWGFSDFFFRANFLLIFFFLAYHAGLSASDRQQILQDWISSKTRVVIATVRTIFLRRKMHEDFFG